MGSIPIVVLVSPDYYRAMGGFLGGTARAAVTFDKGTRPMNIDGKYALGRRLVLGDGIEPNFERGSVLLAEAIRSCALRQVDGPILPSDPRSVKVRLKMLAEARQSAVPPVMIETIYCSSCRLDQSPRRLDAFDRISYKTVHQAIDQALVWADCLSSDQAFPCNRCGQPCERLVDFHMYMSQVGEDLVVRYLNPRITPGKTFQLLWMTKDGRYMHTTRQEIPDKSDLTDTFIASAALSCLQDGDLEGCAGNLKEGLKTFPASKEFLSIAFDLISTSKIGIAEAVAQQYVATYPQDPEGYSCLAQVYTRGYVNSAAMDEELLRTAEEWADASLSRGETYSGQLAKASCMRLRNSPAQQLVPVFESLVSRYPNGAAAFYEYALLWLPHAPAKALNLFERGAQADPNDVDFVIGQVRALIKMEHLDAARQLLKQAQRMAPAHPSVAQLLADTRARH